MKGKTNSAAKFKIRKENKMEIREENKMEIREETKDWIDFNEIRCGDVFRAEDDDYYIYEGKRVSKVQRC